MTFKNFKRKRIKEVSLRDIPGYEYSNAIKMHLYNTLLYTHSYSQYRNVLLGKAYSLSIVRPREERLPPIRKDVVKYLQIEAESIRKNIKKEY